MPGFDRTGPQGAGARTGRGLGRCARPSNESTGVEDPYNYYGLGWGYWPWAGGRGRFGGGGWGRGRGRRGGGGRGRGRGPGWGVGPRDEPISPDLAPGQLGEVLRDHIAALKELLANYAAAGKQNNE